MVVSVIWSGIREFADAMVKVAASADVAGEQIVTKGARIVTTAAKEHASGRPGPEVRSGRLRASIGLVEVTNLGAGRWQSETAPQDVPYERRIELGFHGADSLGRVYNQPAYPYMAPALEEVLPALGALYDAEWAAALRA